MFAPTLNGPRLLYNGGFYSLRLLYLSLWAVILVFGFSHSTSKPPLFLRRRWGNNQTSYKSGLSTGFNFIGRRLTRQDDELWNYWTTEQEIIRQVHKLCFLLVMYTSCYCRSDLCTAYFLHMLSSCLYQISSALFYFYTLPMRLHILILYPQSAAPFPTDIC